MCVRAYMRACVYVLQAAYMGSKAQIHFLLEAKADVQAKTNFGSYLRTRTLHACLLACVRGVRFVVGSEWLDRCASVG